MAAGVLPLSDRICRDVRVLSAVHAAQAALAVLGLPLAILFAPAYRWAIAVLLVLYGARKIMQFRRNDRALKQMRLEQRFFRQQRDRLLLERCLSHDDHVWEDVNILHGLRRVLDEPMPRILSEDAKLERAGRAFRARLDSLRPLRFSPSALLPAAALVLLMIHSVQTPASTGLSLGAAGLVSLVVLELIAFRRSGTIHRRFDHLEYALGRWALDLVPHLAPDSANGAYRHNLLYQDRPIYSA